jgi:hypothetical protein
LIDSTTTPVRPKRASRRRRIWWGVGVLVVILIACTAWVGVRAVLARNHLVDAKNEIAKLRSEVSAGNIDPLAPGLRQVRKDTKAARDLTSDPIWRGMSHLPILGRTLGASSDLAAAADDLSAETLTPLLDAAARINPKQLRKPGGTLDLRRLQEAAPDLRRAQTALAATISTVAHIPVKNVVGAVASSRNQLLTQLDGLVGTVDTASRAAQAAPAMLGAHGPRRYLMVFVTPAEARGTGGLVGSYAIIVADHGKITTERTGSNEELQDSPVPVADLGPEFNARYSHIDSARAWRNANFTPHFPWAAEIWQRLWQRQTGEQVDGVLSVDPVALGYLLDVTGPVRLSDGEVITGKTAATWSMVTSYAKYAGDNDRRKELSTELARKTLDRLSRGTGSSVDLLKALGRAAGEHRLLAWAARPAEEKFISGTPLAGELPDTTAPFTALVLRNASGDKLDYYLERKVDRRVLSCTPTQRTGRVTVTLTNTAPRSGLPEYVTTRSDRRVVPPGQDRVFANIYATRGTRLESATLNGKPADVISATERGLSVYEADVELPIDEPQTATLTLLEPRVEAPLQYLVQPLAKPETLTLEHAC